MAFFPENWFAGKTSRILQLRERLTILLGVGFDCGDCFEGFIEDGDDAILLFQWGIGKAEIFVGIQIKIAYAGRMTLHTFGYACCVNPVEKPVKIRGVQHLRVIRPDSGREVAE